jgi:hypothetical protein
VSVRKVDIAEHLGVSRQAINAFVNQGMPDDSLESAAAWYNARRAARGADAVTPSNKEVPTDESFAQIVAQHRSLKDKAYRQYLSDLEAGDPNQSKSYATYDKLLKTMVALEREAHSRDIASRKYIETTIATSVFGKVLMSIRTELSQLGTKLAPKANPDHPGTAMKAIDEEADRMLRRISAMALDAQSNVTIAEPETEATEDVAGD